MGLSVSQKIEALIRKAHPNYNQDEPLERENCLAKARQIATIHNLMSDYEYYYKKIFNKKEEKLKEEKKVDYNSETEDFIKYYKSWVDWVDDEFAKTKKRAYEQYESYKQNQDTYEENGTVYTNFSTRAKTTKDYKTDDFNNTDKSFEAFRGAFYKNWKDNWVYKDQVTYEYITIKKCSNGSYGVFFDGGANFCDTEDDAFKYAFYLYTKYFMGSNVKDADWW